MEFQAKSPRARWHDPACCKRVQRAGGLGSVETAPSPVVDDDHPVLAVVRAELEAVGTLETVWGQLALQLARKLLDPEESAVSAISKELRSVMARARGRSPATSAANRARALTALTVWEGPSRAALEHDCGLRLPPGTGFQVCSMGGAPVTTRR